MDREKLFEGFDQKHILFGIFFTFHNRLQAAGDTFYEEITCKQFFLLICLSLFQENAPTINELSEIMGSSHQNVKQIINKLEQNGFVRIFQDEQDRRKLRVEKTEKMYQVAEKYQERENEFLKSLYEGLTEEEIAVTLSAMLKIESNLIKLREGSK